MSRPKHVTDALKRDAETGARDRAALALDLPFRRRRGKPAYKVLDEAQDVCEQMAVTQLIADDISSAKAWARASVLLADRRKRSPS